MIDTAELQTTTCPACNRVLIRPYGSTTVCACGEHVAALEWLP